MTEFPSHVRRLLVRTGLALYVAGLPVLAALARLVGHPEYYFDGETQIPATIGRELLHGHLTDAVHYQIIVYQGSLIVDSVLSAAAYAVFGDHLLAWHAVPLAWFAGLSVAGTLMLHRTAGRWALLFPALLSAMPFFVKDGFVSGIGGHAPGAFFSVAGLAAAAYASGDDGKQRWALVAGLLLGFGTWYVRTVLLAIPAALVMVGGRLRGRALLAVGLLSFPLLVAWNVSALQEAGSHPAAAGTTEELTRTVLMGVSGRPVPRVEPTRKVLEATGPAVRTLLFAQPVRHATTQQSFRPLAYQAGTAWAAAWTASLVLLPLALLLPGVRRDPMLKRGVVGAEVLALSYVGAYAVTSLNLDPGIVESLKRYPPVPPGVSGGRYLVPIMGILTLGVAQAVAALGAGLHRSAGALLVAPVLVLGWIPALGDWTHDRDPAHLFSELQPHLYAGAFGPGRGPPLEVHLACEDPDLQSRAAHRDAIGRFFTGPNGPPLLESIDRLREHPNFGDEDIAALVGELGGELAQEFQKGSRSFVELVDDAFGTADQLGPGSGEEWLYGVRRGLLNARWDVPPTLLCKGLCRRAPNGTLPLCPLAGEALASGSDVWPDSPEGLFAPGTPSISDAPADVRDALFFGAAGRLTRENRDLVWPVLGPVGWEPELARAFKQAWWLRGGTVR